MIDFGKDKIVKGHGERGLFNKGPGLQTSVLSSSSSSSSSSSLSPSSSS